MLLLGPAHFTASRTGDVLLSVVEGVQQLEVYFGQYLPQLFVAALTPALIFAFMAWLDLPIALVLLAAALVTLAGADPLAPLGQRAKPRAPRAYAAFGAEFLDAVQGLGTLKAFGQSGDRAALLAARSRDSSRRPWASSGRTRSPAGSPTSGIALGAAAALGLGRAARAAPGPWPSRRCWWSSCSASRSSGRCATSACSFTRACSASPPRGGCWRSSRPVAGP